MRAEPVFSVKAALLTPATLKKSNIYQYFISYFHRAEISFFFSSFPSFFFLFFPFPSYERCRDR